MLQATAASAQLARLRAARVDAPPLAALTPAGYARGHAGFEARSDQRHLIGEYLAGRLGDRRIGPIAVLSAGCGDGSLDAPLAAELADALPTRPVRYVGVDPYAASTRSFSAAMTYLRRPSLTAEVLVSGFDDAEPVGLFDVVAFVHSMYYVPDVAATLRTAYALLEPGGELLVVQAPHGELNRLAVALAPPVEGHRQWFSNDVVAGLAEAGLHAEPMLTLAAQIDLTDASDEILDFTVQAQLTPVLRPLVRDYLDAISLPGTTHVPHPVDVFRVGA